MTASITNLDTTTTLLPAKLDSVSFTHRTYARAGDGLLIATSREITGVVRDVHHFAGGGITILVQDDETGDIIRRRVSHPTGDICS